MNKLIQHSMRLLSNTAYINKSSASARFYFATSTQQSNTSNITQKTSSNNI